MAKGLNIKKGDVVKVIAGKDKGAEGRVIQVLREEQRVIVEGVNRVKKHTKVIQSGGRAGTTGGIITTEAPIHVSNVMQTPGLSKIVVNMGVGEAARDAKVIDGAVRDLSLITGQKPAVARAKKSVAQFKLREGMPIGAHVTLRGDRMWEFLDRLLTLALPRIRDFRGLNDRQFDGRGNYTFGLTEQLMFHEINPDQVDRQRGMDVTVVTTATTDAEGRSLLRRLGFPFKES